MASQEPTIIVVDDTEDTVEDRVDDDASDSKRPLPGKNPTRPSRTSKPSTRSGRAALSRQPQDHKPSQAALDAQRREAAVDPEDGEDDGVERVGFDYEGIRFVFDPAQINIGFQLKCERGAPVSALVQLFGAEVIEQIQTWPFNDIQELITRATKAAGLGGS